MYSKIETFVTKQGSQQIIWNNSSDLLEGYGNRLKLDKQYGLTDYILDIKSIVMELIKYAAYYICRLS